jgi:predicted MFS family arabinose efflux permease
VQTAKRGRKRPNPLASLKIAGEKEAGLILWYGSLLYSGYFMVLRTLPTWLHARYGFDSLNIGLCYPPLGMGSLTSRWTVGRIVAYSRVIDYKTNLASPLTMLFFTGHLVTGSFSSLHILVVDINKETPATAVAANDLFPLSHGRSCCRHCEPSNGSH